MRLARSTDSPLVLGQRTSTCALAAGLVRSKDCGIALLGILWGQNGPGEAEAECEKRIDEVLTKHFCKRDTDTQQLPEPPCQPGVTDS
jgi:hypothetical protein